MSSSLEGWLPVGPETRPDVSLVQELLRRFEVHAPRRALLEELAPHASLDVLADCIERCGLRARVVALAKGDTARLTTALVRLTDRSLGLWDGRRNCLTLSNGERLSAPDVDARIANEAIEVSPPWPREGRFLQRMWQLCREQPATQRALSLFGVSVVGASAFGFAQPALTRVIVDSAIPENATSTLDVLVAALFIAAVGGALASSLGERALLSAELRLTAAVQPGIFAHYMTLPLRLLQRQSPGDVLQCERAVSPVIHGALNEPIQAVTASFLAVGYLLWIFHMAPGVAVGLVAAHALLACVSLPLAVRAARSQQALLTASAKQNDLLLQMIERIRLLRAQGATRWATDRWLCALSLGQARELEGDMASSLLGELTGLVQRLVAGGVVLFAASACLNGQRSLGEFFALVAAASGAGGALGRLIGLGSQLLSLRQHLLRIDHALSLKGEAPRASDSPPLASAGITCDDVWFRYSDDAPWVLRSFSAKFEAGRIHTLRWPSGTGKSTLLRLLAGIHHPERGTISVLGADSRAARRLVRYVPQACPLFAGSIMHNLRMLSGTRDATRLHQAASLTGLDRVVSGWSMAFETLVASGGSNLSSGQRQLIILTAALASPQPVLLLDEATTHVDLILRAQLEQSPLLHSRTIINVMHFDAGAP